jgi:serine/threonine-protein kinase
MGFEDSLGDLVSPGEVLADKYRVEKVLGTGGMGVVVQAWHLHFDERVAVKFLHAKAGASEENLARFEREARAAFKIKSEHVARVIDVGKLPDGAPFMVMEFLEGTDLGDLLSDRRRLPIDEAVNMVLQASEAVAEAHTLGIVHRDLKPENLFLSERADGSPTIKVLDFGLSKFDGSAASERRERSLTSTAQVMGTPQYMSPEQWMSARDVGAATDQWALAVILYELITGAQPFNREQIAQLCTMVLNGDPPPMRQYLPTVPGALEAVILRALEKEPEDRWPNIGEFAVRLLDFAPRTGRTSVKRIRGVFARAGVEVQEPMPPSADGSDLHAISVSMDAPVMSPLVTGLEGEPSSPDGSGAREMVTLPKVPPPHRAAETAQTFNQIMSMRPRRAVSGKVAIVAAMCLVLAGVIIYVASSGDTAPTSASDASAGPAVEQLPAPPGEVHVAEVEAAIEPAATASASAVPSASAATKKTNPQRRSVKKVIRRPSRPPQKTDIFGSR